MSAQPKKWAEYTHEERRESFNNYAKYNIIQAIKSQTAPWLKPLVFEDNEGNLWQKVFKAYSMFNISRCNNIDMEKLKEHQKKNNI